MSEKKTFPNLIKYLVAIGTVICAVIYYSKFF